MKAAIEVFATHGQSATISDIAKAANVQDAVIYRNCSSKDWILLSIYEDFWNKILEQTKTAAEFPTSTISTLRMLISAVTILSFQEKSLVKAVVRSYLPPYESYPEGELRDKRLNIRKIYNEAYDILDNIIKTGQERKEIIQDNLKPQIIRHMLVGYLLSASYGLLKKEENIPYNGQDAEAGLNFLLEMLQPKKSTE